MSLRAFSWWFRSSLGRSPRQTSGAAARAGRQTGHRTLRLEQLEGRQLLSVGLGVGSSNVAQSPSPAALTAAGRLAVPAAIDVVTSGPTISRVVMSESQRVISWNAADAAGVTSSTLTIDGAPATRLYGPYTVAPGLNYAATYGGLTAGAHTCVITATDSAGLSSQYTGTFTVAGPAISRVMVSTSQGLITWNAAAADGVASSSLTVDGTPVTRLYGPYTVAPGLNYAAVYGALSSGSHTYTIAATDAAGDQSQLTGTFTVAGPTITRVVVSAAQGLVTWIAAAASGVASSTLTVDGTAVGSLFGPVAVPPGLAYAGNFAVPSSGSHTYVITATDSAGNWSQFTGTFAVGPTIARVAVSTAQGAITWIAADPAGVASSSITIDGASVANLFGPYTVPPGLAYAAAYGALSLGSHTYVITATNSVGSSSQSTGTFNVTG